MGGGYHGDAPLPGNVAEDGGDGDAGGAIQLSGGFVGKQYRRAGDQGAGDGYPLLFAAGKLVGAVTHPGTQTYQFQRFRRSLPPFPPGRSHNVQGQFHVLVGRQQGYQSKGLEHETDPGTAQFHQLRLGKPGQVPALNGHYAGSRPVQSGQQVEHGGLAGTGAAHYR